MRRHLMTDVTENSHIYRCTGGCTGGCTGDSSLRSGAFFEPLFSLIASTGLVLLLCFSSVVLADTRFDQRIKYQQAMKYLQSGQRSRFLKLKDQLSGYALEPYLAYSDITRRLSRQTPEQIEAFRQQYAATPLANSLMQNWLYSLGKR